MSNLKYLGFAGLAALRESEVIERLHSFSDLKGQPVYAPDDQEEVEELGLCPETEAEIVNYHLPELHYAVGEAYKMLRADSRLSFLDCRHETLYCVSDAEASDWHRCLERHVVEVSPALARHWLLIVHPEQRNIAPGNARKIGQELRQGRWEHTHQGLAFTWREEKSECGTSVWRCWNVDGQHRLTELAKGDRSAVFDVAVFRDLSVTAPMDQGGKRPPTFVTGLPRAEVATTSALLRLQMGALYGGKALSPGEITAAYHANRDDVDGILTASSGGAYLRAPCAGALAFCRPLGPVAVDAFATKLSTGIGLLHGEPVHALRESLIRTFANGRSAKQSVLSCLTFSAVLATLEQRKLKKVYNTELAYRRVCALRAQCNIPNTPTLPERIVRPTEAGDEAAEE